MLRYILLRGVLGWACLIFAVITVWDRLDDGYWPSTTKLIRSLVIWSLAGVLFGWSMYRREQRRSSKSDEGFSRR